MSAVRTFCLWAAVAVGTGVAAPTLAEAQEAATEEAETTETEDAVATAERTQQESSDVTGSVANRQAAAQAYDRAANYYVGEQYRSAGQWFMAAYRLAPARAALVQAVRSYRRAGSIQRAGTLALLLAQSFPDDGPAVQLATEVMDEAGRNSVHITVACDGCAVEVDGRLLATLGAYVTAGQPHQVIAHFGDMQETRAAQGEEGEQVFLEIETPEGANLQNEELEPEHIRRARERANDPGIRVLHPAVFWSALVVTAAVGGLTVWSGLDTVAGVDAYELMPTQEAYDAGQDKEFRTNLLIGVSAGLAAITLLSIVFTNFGGSPDEEAPTTVSFGASPEGAMFMLRSAL